MGFHEILIHDVKVLECLRIDDQLVSSLHSHCFQICEQLWLSSGVVRCIPTAHLKDDGLGIVEYCTQYMEIIENAFSGSNEAPSLCYWVAMLNI